MTRNRTYIFWPKFKLKNRVVNLRLHKLGRTGPVGPEFQLSRAGPFRPKISAGRAGSFFANIPRRFFQYPPFLKEQYLILNELLIKFKFSLKNLSKIRIEIKLSMTGPRFQLGRAVTVQDFCGPGRYTPVSNI